MKLADLVDLEAQLARDAGIEPARLHERDRALVAGTAGSERPHRLLAHWLAALRAREPARWSLGRRVAATLRAIAALAVLVGLLVGWGTTHVLLLYDGSRPVNVWDVLLVLVGLQLLLLVLTIASLCFPVRAVGIPLFGGVRWILQRAWRGLAFRLPIIEGERHTYGALMARLRTRHRLYVDIEAWSLLALTQTFGVAFNLGALLAFLRLVAFSDLAFAWSTTLELEGAQFQHLVAALAKPWAALAPDAVPSAALVEATRWSRLVGAYVDPNGARAASVHAGGWWPFLLLALVTYGLAPRAVLLVAAHARRAWLLARLPFDDLEVRALLRRLTNPHVSLRAEVQEAPSADERCIAVAPLAGLDFGAEPCELVLWRDIPHDRLDAAVGTQLHCPVGAVHTAGGRHPDATERTCDALLRTRGPVVIAAEGWEPPDGAALEFLTRVRRCAGANRPIVVLLAGLAASGGVGAPASRDVEVWSRRLGRLGDPHLALVPLEPGP